MFVIFAPPHACPSIPYHSIRRAGTVESRDGGASWAKAIAPPKEMGGVSALSWMDYDPLHDVLYIMKMGSELYRLERGK